MKLMNLFSSKENELVEKAQTLVPAITVMADTVYWKILEKYPVLKKVKENDWNFYIKIASVVAATLGLMKIDINRKTKSKISKIYGKDLEEWDTNWSEAFKDCNEFLYANIEKFDSGEYQQNPRFRVSDTLGWWLVWNLLSTRPTTNDEVELIRPLGLLVTVEFAQWWGNN